MSASMQKFTSPSLPRDLIQRTQLESSLMDGLRNKARLFLISAPAGYGKSTLIANWVCANHIEHLWFNLDASDNDLPVFLDVLREGLRIEKSGQPAQKNSGVGISEEVNTLVKHIQQREKTFLLIFDRLDNVGNTRVQDFLFELATQLDPHAAVVLISRRQPELQVSRMRAYNQLVEINESSLEFTPQEIREFLRLETGGEVPVRNLKNIEQKTRGWAAGLRLAVDLLDGDLLSEDNPGVARLNGAQRYLADYFEEEVFEELEPALQDFLIRSSVLDRFQQHCAGSPSGTATLKRSSSGCRTAICSFCRLKISRVGSVIILCSGIFYYPNAQRKRCARSCGKPPCGSSNKANWTRL